MTRVPRFKLFLSGILLSCAVLQGQGQTGTILTNPGFESGTTFVRRRIAWYALVSVPPPPRIAIGGTMPMSLSERVTGAATALVLLVVSVTASSAGTIQVPADQPTIQAGLDAALPGDTVLVACGAYGEHDLVMKSGVVLRSAGGVAACATISAGGSGRVMSCSHVTNASIEGFTVRDGSTIYYGGGIYCEFSSLAIRPWTSPTRSGARTSAGREAPAVVAGSSGPARRPAAQASRAHSVV